MNNANNIESSSLSNKVDEQNSNLQMSGEDGYSHDYTYNGESTTSTGPHATAIDVLQQRQGLYVVGLFLVLLFIVICVIRCFNCYFYTAHYYFSSESGTNIPIPQRFEKRRRKQLEKELRVKIWGGEDIAIKPSTDISNTGDTKDGATNNSIHTKDDIATKLAIFTPTARNLETVYCSTVMEENSEDSEGSACSDASSYIVVHFGTDDTGIINGTDFHDGTNQVETEEQERIARDSNAAGSRMGKAADHATSLRTTASSVVIVDDKSMESGDISSCEMAAPSCSICLSAFRNGQLICEASNPRCRHRFHKDCMSIWLMLYARCPVCREIYLEK